MPKSPPPPRSAQNSSGSDSWVTCTSSPSGVTRSTETTLLAVKPCARVNQLTPPPSSRPTTDGSGLLPHRAIRPVPSSSSHQLAELDAGADDGGALLDVDRDHAEGAGAEEEGVVQGGAGGVTGGLRGHGDAGLDRPADGGDHVGGVGDLEDGGGLLVDVDLPGHPGLLPVAVGAGDQPAVDDGAQGVPVDAADRARGEGGGGHGVVLLRWVSGCRAPPSRPALSATLGLT